MRLTEDKTKIPMPVLLTCPHGGIARLSPKRVDTKLPPGCSRDNFSDDSDLLTFTLLRAFQQIYIICQKKKFIKK